MCVYIFVLLTGWFYIVWNYINNILWQILAAFLFLPGCIAGMAAVLETMVLFSRALKTDIIYTLFRHEAAIVKNIKAEKHKHTKHKNRSWSWSWQAYLRSQCWSWKVSLFASYYHSLVYKTHEWRCTRRLGICKTHCSFVVILTSLNEDSLSHILWRHKVISLFA